VLSLSKTIQKHLQITHISHIRAHAQQTVVISLDRKAYIMVKF